MRPTPSAFMMNGPMWSLGGESALKSGTSLPTHFFCASLHQICGREASQGLPETSHDARLYITRRFIGHDHPQFGWAPRPEGSELSRRCISAPASVQEPHQIQFPLEVEPSSFNAAKPGNCWPVSRSRPFSSFATSDKEGLAGTV